MGFTYIRSGKIQKYSQDKGPPNNLLGDSYSEVRVLVGIVPVHEFQLQLESSESFPPQVGTYRCQVAQHAIGTVAGMSPD